MDGVGGEGGPGLRACKGFAMSAAALIEGLCEGFEGLAIAALPHEEDREHCRNNGESWLPELGKHDPLRRLAQGGDWRLAWSRGWSADSPRTAVVLAMRNANKEAAELEAAIDGQLRTMPKPTPRL